MERVVATAFPPFGLLVFKLNGGWKFVFGRVVGSGWVGPRVTVAPSSTVETGGELDRGLAYHTTY